MMALPEAANPGVFTHMIKRYLPKLLGILFLGSSVAIAEQPQDDFLSGFITGQYILVGKSPGSDNTYHGKVQIVSTDNGVEVHRIISDKTITGSGAIEKTTADSVSVLRIRFKENEIEFEETCMIHSDLDNYARITCYLYRSGARTGNPGLEVFFIDH